ncbi:DUF2953 domain-containing protein [Priestia koreensis]|uniref:DUF2953 domain-containing protein n=1 Tax=Priestia koreensis TaxID=284581 RepID=UPI001F56C90B|nr:DUF2953 domain-containing protein [Priestia koreensis]UNL84498.1 DUF2953 domain-containing protein [Priestia koreensis]
MIWIWSVLLILVVLLFLLFWTKLTIVLVIKHIGDDDRITLKFSAWFGLIRYKYEIPLIQVDDDSPTLVVEENKGTDTAGGDSKNKKTKKFSLHDIQETVHNTRELFRHIIGFHRIIRRFLRRITLTDVSWRSAVGAGDAAHTGMLVGAIWTAKSGIISLMSQYFRLVGQPFIAIQPDFQRLRSQTHLSCIFKFRIGHAIVAGLLVFKYWRSAYGGRKELFAQLFNKDKQQSSVES